MQLNEVRSLHVPMGLFGLRFEVDGVGQTRVEQIDEFEPRFFWKADAGRKELVLGCCRHKGLLVAWIPDRFCGMQERRACWKVLRRHSMSRRVIGSEVGGWQANPVQTSATAAPVARFGRLGIVSANAGGRDFASAASWLNRTMDRLMA